MTKVKHVNSVSGKSSIGNLTDTASKYKQSTSPCKNAFAGCRRNGKRIYTSFGLYANGKQDLIMANPKVFPLEPLNLLNKILSKAKSLQVASVYVESGFGITELVFESADFNQGNLKYYNAMPFNISFVSDCEYNLED